MAQTPISGISIQVDASQAARIATAFALAPDIIGTYMRDVFGQFGGSFRRQLLASSRPGMRELARRSVFYSLRPKQKKTRGVAKQALIGYQFTERPKMENISLLVFSTSKVTLLHEVGGVVRAKDGGSMAIPVRGRKTRKPGSAKIWNLKGAKRRERLPARLKNNGDKLVRLGKILYRTSPNKKGRRTYEPTHLLLREVRIKPQLGIMRTWDSMAGDRQRRMQKAIDGAAEEIARRIGTSIGSTVQGVLRGVA